MITREYAKAHGLSEDTIGGYLLTPEEAEVFRQAVEESHAKLKAHGHWPYTCEAMECTK